MRSLVLAVAAGIVLCLTLLLLLLRYSLPALPDYRRQVEEVLSGHLGAPVRIQSIEASWHGWKLVLNAAGVEVRTSAAHRTRIDRLDLELALLPLLLERRQLRIDRVRMHGAELHLQDEPLAGVGGAGPFRLSQLPLDLSMYDSRIVYALDSRTAVTLVLPRLWSGQTGDHHRLQASVHLPGKRRQVVQLELQWPDKLETESLSARFAGDDLDLSLWLRELELTVPDAWPRPGNTPVQLAGELHWQQGRLHSARLHASGDLQLLPASGVGPPANLPGTTLLLASRENRDGTRFLGGYLRGAALSSTSAPPAPPWDNEFRLALPPGEDRALLRLDRFDLALLRRLWPLLPDAASLPSPANASGRLQRAELWLGDDYAARLWFEDVDIPEAIGPLEALQGLTGQLEFDARGGRAELQATALHAALPRPHGYMLELTAPTGRFNWFRQEDGGISLNIETLRARPPDAGAALLRGGVRWHDDEQLEWLDLRLHLKDIGHDALLALLPAAAREQVASILLAADFPLVELEWVGPPVLAGAGDASPARFLATGEFADAIYLAREGVPPLRDAAGRFQLRHQDLQLSLDVADWHGMALTGASLTIPDVRAAGNYDFAFSLDGDAARFRELSSHWEPWLEAPWQLQGDVQFQVRAAVRAPDGADHVLESLQGVLSFDELTVLNPELGAAFYDLAGDIHLTQDHLAGERIQGRYRDSRVQLDMRYPDAAGEFAIDAQLEASAEAITRELAIHTGDHAELHDLLERALSGHSRWDVAARKRADDTWSFDLQSDLRGLAVALPAPLGKAAEATAPFEFKLLFEPHRQARLELHHRGQTLTGRLDKDGEPASLHWQGDVARLSVEQWSAWLAGDATTPPQAPHGLDLDLDIEALSWRGQDYALQVHARDTPQAWQVELDGEDLQGLVRVPRGTDPTWDIILEHWVYAPQDRAPESTDAQPRGFPQMRLAVEELRFGWDSENTWRLRLAGQRRPDGGMDYHVISLTGVGLELAGTGNWQSTGTGDNTCAVALTLEVEELGSFLRLVGETSEGITGAPGTLSLDASWPGNPRDFSLAALEGTLQLDFGAGTLEQVDTGGAWLFGLFSLQTPLNILLTLNPLEPLKREFSFDHLHGELAIRDGHAHTEGLKLEGDSLGLTVTGRSGLVARDYDHEVIAVPNIYDSLAIPGLIFGPVGLGAGYAISILGRAIPGLPEGINQVARKRYHVSGSWDDPVVEILTPSPAEPQTQIELQSP